MMVSSKKGADIHRQMLGADEDFHMSKWSAKHYKHVASNFVDRFVPINFLLHPNKFHMLLFQLQS